MVKKNKDKQMPQFTRDFCDDEGCLRTLSAISSQSAVEKLTDPDKQFSHPSHKADLWRYADMYEHGGVYLDMKIAVLQPLHPLLLEKQRELAERIKGQAQASERMETEQDQVQAESSKGQAHAQERPSKPELLPFFLAAIGANNDHIFQGTIVCTKRRPLMAEALVDASITTQDEMKRSYLKFCKYLYGLIKKSSLTKDEEKLQPGWISCGRFGWVYLLKEIKTTAKRCCPESESDIECDGHFLVDAAKDSKQWFATRCWGWKNGFKGDPVAVQRFLKMAEETKEAAKAAEEAPAEEDMEASAEDETRPQNAASSSSMPEEQQD